MTKNEINNLNEEAKKQLAKKLAEKWSMEDHIELFSNEVRMPAEVEDEEWIREIIENRGTKQAEKQAGKLTGKHARRRAKKRAREWAIWDE